MSRKNKNKEEIEETVDEQITVFHIYDFLVRCRINRSQHEIFYKKYEGNGLKTLAEWEKITKLKATS